MSAGARRTRGGSAGSSNLQQPSAPAPVQAATIVSAQPIVAMVEEPEPTVAIATLATLVEAVPHHPPNSGTTDAATLLAFANTDVTMTEEQTIKRKGSFEEISPHKKLKTSTNGASVPILLAAPDTNLAFIKDEPHLRHLMSTVIPSPMNNNYIAVSPSHPPPTHQPPPPVVVPIVKQPQPSILQSQAVSAPVTHQQIPLNSSHGGISLNSSHGGIPLNSSHGGISLTSSHGGIPMAIGPMSIGAMGIMGIGPMGIGPMAAHTMQPQHTTAAAVMGVGVGAPVTTPAAQHPTYIDLATTKASLQILLETLGAFETVQDLDERGFRAMHDVYMNLHQILETK